MTLQKAKDSFSKSCACGENYSNNCAHYLSNALILGGYSAINGGEGADLRIRNGFCVCKSGRPIRAKELRTWFGNNWTSHSSPKDNGLMLVYQERASDGQGHVLLKEYKAGKQVSYAGTGDYPEWATQEYYY